MTNNTTTTTTRTTVSYLRSADNYEAKLGLTMEYNFPDSLLGGTTGEDALEIVFCQCQAGYPDGSWLEKSGLRTRSLSVGDIIRLDGDYYITERVGFKKITPEAAEFFVKDVSSRDFFMSVETTLKYLVEVGRKGVPEKVFA